MTRLPVSGCTIIRNALEGAFCLFESMAMMLPVVDDVHVMDMGSTDGTLELLRDIAAVNKRVHIYYKDYPWTSASVLADASNDVVALARHDNVLFWQADEIWHENLILAMCEMFERGEYDLMFWRYQLRDNFQKMYWYPLWVHRAGTRKDGRFHFVADGMNTGLRTNVKPVPEGHSGDWHKWYMMDLMSIPTCDMILDVSSMGAFRDNVVRRKELHHPLWGQSHFDIEGSDPEEWQQKANADPAWTKHDTPFDIPAIMRYHVGKVSYKVRPELLEALKNDVAREYLDGI